MKFYDIKGDGNPLNPDKPWRDKRGELPELVIICSPGRGLGKTFSATKMLYDDYISQDRKFILLCRKKLELGTIFTSVFKDYLDIEHPDEVPTETIQQKGVFSNCYLTTQDPENEEKKIKKHVGYVIPLASNAEIKRTSTNFTDADIIVFDEFIDINKTGYLSNEVERFLSIVTSVARGGGQSRRFIPCVFLSNALSLFNPYFIKLEMHKKIQSNTKKYKGDGFVFQKISSSNYEDIIKQHEESGLARAFSGSTNELRFRDDDSWKNDNINCIGKGDIDGHGEYFCTLQVGNEKSLAVKYYPSCRKYYIDYNVDKDCQMIFNIKYDDMTPNVPLLRGSLTMMRLREAMELGIVRFKDMIVKDICFDMFI